MASLYFLLVQLLSNHYKAGCTHTKGRLFVIFPFLYHLFGDDKQVWASKSSSGEALLIPSSKVEIRKAFSVSPAGLANDGDHIFILSIQNKPGAIILHT